MMSQSHRLMWVDMLEAEKHLSSFPGFTIKVPIDVGTLFLNIILISNFSALRQTLLGERKNNFCYY